MTDNKDTTRLRGFACGNHNTEAVKKINIDPGAKQTLFCLECIMDLDRVAKDSLISLDAFVQSIFSVLNQTRDIRIETKPPTVLTGPIDSESEIFDKFKAHIEEQKKFVTEQMRKLGQEIIDIFKVQQRRILRELDHQYVLLKRNFEDYKVRVNKYFDYDQGASILDKASIYQELNNCYDVKDLELRIKNYLQLIHDDNFIRKTVKLQTNKLGDPELIAHAQLLDDKEEKKSNAGGSELKDSKPGSEKDLDKKSDAAGGGGDPDEAKSKPSGSKDNLDGGDQKSDRGSAGGGVGGGGEGGDGPTIDLKDTPQGNEANSKELEDAIVNKMVDARERLMDMANRLPETAMAHEEWYQKDFDILSVEIGRFLEKVSVMHHTLPTNNYDSNLISVTEFETLSKWITDSGPVTMKLIQRINIDNPNIESFSQQYHDNPNVVAVFKTHDKKILGVYRDGKNGKFIRKFISFDLTNKVLKPQYGSLASFTRTDYLNLSKFFLLLRGNDSYAKQEIAKYLVAAGKMELLNEKFICYFFNSLDPKKKNEVDSIEGIKEIELFEVDFPGRVDDIKDTKVKSKEKLGLASKIDVKDSISNLPKKKTAVRNKSPNPFESLYNRSKV